MMLNFPDKCVPYDVFVKDVARNVVRMLSEVRNEPEYISQRKAYIMFGRGNVDRWRRLGKVEPYIRPGKVEYRTAELRSLKEFKQDYLLI